MHLRLSGGGAARQPDSGLLEACSLTRILASLFWYAASGLSNQID